jgi:hypothetical protein
MSDHCSPEAAQFEIVLDELRGLFADFTTIGVSVMLIGGQVLAVEGPSRARLHANQDVSLGEADDDGRCPRYLHAARRRRC